GWGIGMGRMGAILSPLVAGRLIDAHWQPSDLYLLFASAFVVAAIAVWRLNSRAVPQVALKPAA
ncbi:MAG: MFS transporter, partial [Pseudomonas sp.]